MRRKISVERPCELEEVANADDILISHTDRSSSAADRTWYRWYRTCAAVHRLVSSSLRARYEAFSSSVQWAPRHGSRLWDESGAAERQGESVRTLAPRMQSVRRAGGTSGGAHASHQTFTLNQTTTI